MKLRVIKAFIFSLLTSGKYTEVQDEKNLDPILRLIVLNIVYAFASIIIISIGVSDMRNGLINQGLMQLIFGSMIFLNLLLLRSELPIAVGGFILVVVYGAFCGMSIFTKNDLDGFFILWIYS